MYLFLLIFSARSTKISYLRVYIFHIGSKSEKTTENNMKYSVSDIDLLCFVIIQSFSVQLLKNKMVSSLIVSKWLYCFSLCVCVCACFIKEISLSYLEKKIKEKVIPHLLPLPHPQTTNFSHSLSPMHRVKEEISLWFSSPASDS